MLGKLRSRLTYPYVVSTLALFVALGTSGAYATHLVVNGSDVVNESLTGVDVRGKAGTSTTAAVNGTVTGHDVSGQRANASNKTPFVEGSLTGDDVRGSEGTNERAPVNGSLTGADISGQSGDRFKGIPFVDGSLTTWDIKDSTLSGNDLADGSVASPQVTDETLTGDDIIEPSLGKVGDADTLDGKDSTAFGGPTEAFHAANNSSVNFDGVSPAEIVASKSVPAGTHLLLAKVKVENTSSFLARLTCVLRDAPDSAIVPVLDSATVDLPGNSSGDQFGTTLPLMAAVTLASAKTVTLSCGTLQGTGNANTAKLAAVRVDSMN